MFPAFGFGARIPPEYTVSDWIEDLSFDWRSGITWISFLAASVALKESKMIWTLWRPSLSETSSPSVLLGCSQRLWWRGPLLSFQHAVDMVRDRKHSRPWPPGSFHSDLPAGDPSEKDQLWIFIMKMSATLTEVSKHPPCMEDPEKRGPATGELEGS